MSSKFFTALEYNRPSYRTKGTPKPDNPRKSGMFGCNLTPDGFFFKYGKTVTEIKCRSEESDMPLSSFLSIQNSHLNVYGNGGQAVRTPKNPVLKLKKSLRQSILPKSFVWPSTPETGGTRLLKSDLIFDITRHAGYMLLHIQKKPPVLSNRGAADGLYFCSPICCLCSGSGGPLLMQ